MPLTAVLLPLLLLCPHISLAQAAEYFVEEYTDHKNNHLADKLSYSFHYAIGEGPTHARLTHREERRGTYVSGQYGLIEPGGSVRHVRYEVNGRPNSIQQHQLIRLRLPQPLEPIWHARPVAYVL